MATQNLYHACVTGDAQALLHLVEDQDAHFLEQQRFPPWSGTALHIASSHGHVGLVKELLRLRPALASVENNRLETALHEACREGHTDVAELLLETDTPGFHRLNRDGEDAFDLACACGNLAVAKLFVRFLGLRDVMHPTMLHLAIMGGHTQIVREITKFRPDFVRRKDPQGDLPIHLAIRKGHVDTVRDFLKLDSDLCTVRGGDGRTALQVAVSKGLVNVVNEILSTKPKSFKRLSARGESVLHVGVENNQYEAVKHLVERLDVDQLVNQQDHNGNTVLHLAAIGKLSTMAGFLLEESVVIDVNIKNNSGFTALDLVEIDSSNSTALQLVETLRAAGGKRGEELRAAREIPFSSTTNSSSRYGQQVPRRDKQRLKLENETEGLREIRSRITIVTVLVATVTFTVGFNPPGGVYQIGEGPKDLVGKAVAGRTTAFKIFKISNDIAFFSSLAIVVVLVSIIPFKTKEMMRLLTVTDKLMWGSVTSMVVAYLAASWVVVPVGRGTVWVMAVVLTVGGGTTLFVFVWLLRTPRILSESWSMEEKKEDKKEEKKEEKKGDEKKKEEKKKDEKKKQGMPLMLGSSDYASDSSETSGDYHLF